MPKKPPKSWRVDTICKCGRVTRTELEVGPNVITGICDGCGEVWRIDIFVENDGNATIHKGNITQEITT